MTGGVDVPRRHGPMIALVGTILLVHFLFRPGLAYSLAATGDGAAPVRAPSTDATAAFGMLELE